jgi:AcrR family transcriptional regulator
LRPKLKTEDRQAELVAAALLLAATKSPSEITTGDLANVIGITQGGVFKHFDSKEAIWLAAIEWAHQDLMKKLMLEAKVRNQTAFKSLRAVFMAHIGFVQQYPGVPRLIFQELQHPEQTLLKEKVQLLMADYRQLISGLLAQARKDAEISPEADLQAAVVLFIGAIQGLVMQSLITGSLEKIKQQAKTVFSIYEAGLLACSVKKAGTSK